MNGNGRSALLRDRERATASANAADAVKAAAGIASTPHADGIAPSSAATTRNTVDATKVRIALPDHDAAVQLAARRSASPTTPV